MPRCRLRGAGCQSDQACRLAGRLGGRVDRRLAGRDQIARMGWFSAARQASRRRDFADNPLSLRGLCMTSRKPNSDSNIETGAALELAERVVVPLALEVGRYRLRAGSTAHHCHPPDPAIPAASEVCMSPSGVRPMRPQVQRASVPWLWAETARASCLPVQTPWLDGWMPGLSQGICLPGHPAFLPGLSDCPCRAISGPGGLPRGGSTPYPGLPPFKGQLASPRLDRR